MTIGDIIVIAIVLVPVGFAVRSLWKSRKSGSCCGDCSSCGGSCGGSCSSGRAPEQKK